MKIKIYNEIEYDKSEILRYSGSKNDAESILAMVDECIDEVGYTLDLKVCYEIYPLEQVEDKLKFGSICTASNTIKKAAEGCGEVLFFAATAGSGMDRYIMKYNLLSPAKALIMQALGSERAESLCNRFCADMAKTLSEQGRSLKPRVSPGYGDIELEMQKDFFRMLDLEKNLGLTLNPNLLMTPEKSVTAIAGIKIN